MKTYQIDLTAQTFENLLKIHCEKEPNITHDVQFVVTNRPKRYPIIDIIQQLMSRRFDSSIGNIRFTYNYFQHNADKTDTLSLSPRLTEA